MYHLSPLPINYIKKEINLYSDWEEKSGAQNKDLNTQSKIHVDDVQHSSCVVDKGLKTHSFKHFASVKQEPKDLETVKEENELPEYVQIQQESFLKIEDGCGIPLKRLSKITYTGVPSSSQEITRVSIVQPDFGNIEVKTENVCCYPKNQEDDIRCDGSILPEELERRLLESARGVKKRGSISVNHRNRCKSRAKRQGKSKLHEDKVIQQSCHIKVKRSLSKTKTKAARRKVCEEDVCEFCSYSTMQKPVPQSHKNVNVTCQKCAKSRSTALQKCPCACLCEKKPNKCEICEKGFKYCCHFTHHKNTHRDEKPFKFKCDMCQKCFHRYTKLSIHMRIHTGERPFKCPVCHKGFRNGSDFIKHQRIHTGIRPFSCEFCPKLFFSASGLLRHKRIHSAEKPYQCDICQKCFRGASDLRKHKHRHFGKKPYKCDMCQQFFSELIHVSRHMNAHTGERPFKCDICQKCFGRSYHLNRHKQLHTGEKPFMCDSCAKCFSHRYELTAHMRTHTGEMPYKCNDCQRCFTNIGSLVKHKRIHTGEKPYECEFCQKCFRTSYKLKRHKLTHNKKW